MCGVLETFFCFAEYQTQKISTTDDFGSDTLFDNLAVTDADQF